LSRYVGNNPINRIDPTGLEGRNFPGFSGIGTAWIPTTMGSGETMLLQLGLLVDQSLMQVDAAQSALQQYDDDVSNNGRSLTFEENLLLMLFDEEPSATAPDPARDALVAKLKEAIQDFKGTYATQNYIAVKNGLASVCVDQEVNTVISPWVPANVYTRIQGHGLAAAVLWAATERNSISVGGLQEGDLLPFPGEGLVLDAGLWTLDSFAGNAAKTAAKYGEGGSCGIVARAVDAKAAGMGIKLGTDPATLETLAKLFGIEDVTGLNNLSAMASQFGLNENAWSEALFSKSEVIDAILGQSARDRTSRFIIAAIDKGVEEEVEGHFFNAIMDASGHVTFFDGTLPEGTSVLRSWDYYSILKTSGGAK
jgi:hypothetical protein